MIFSRQSFLSEKTFQFHELFYYKIAFQMKTFILSIIVTMITSVAGAQQKSFYDFTVKTIDGKDLPLSTFKGKKVLVVNVASKCGFTPQYAKLEELYENMEKMILSLSDSLPIISCIRNPERMKKSRSFVR